MVFVACDDFGEGHGLGHARDLDLHVFMLIGIGNDDHVASLDSCDPIALVADRLDLDVSAITLSNRWSGLSSC